MPIRAYILSIDYDTERVINECTINEFRYNLQKSEESEMRKNKLEILYNIALYTSNYDK